MKKKINNKQYLKITHEITKCPPDYKGPVRNLEIFQSPDRGYQYRLIWRFLSFSGYRLVPIYQPIFRDIHSIHLLIVINIVVIFDTNIIIIIVIIITSINSNH